MNMFLGERAYKAVTDVLKEHEKNACEDRYLNMTQDLNGNELVIGDKILICIEKDYGWLGYAHIIGESKLTWRIKLEDSNTYNQTRNFDKNPKRIIKC